MTARWRNIVIFIVGVYTLSIIGCVLVARGQDFGGLIFVVSPILMAVSLRLFAREGWATAGLRPNIRGHGFDYALAVLVFPMLVAISLVFGGLTGALDFPEGLVGLLLPAILTMLPITMLYAMCEEFGWRGYLEPQLELLGVSDLRRHLLVGFIWALWHIPYLMTFANMGNLPLAIFIPLYLVGTLSMAVWYGVSRKRTNSVWPAIIAHGGMNAIMWPLVVDGMITIHDELWFSPRPDSVLMAGLLVLIAAMVLRRRL